MTFVRVIGYKQTSRWVRRAPHLLVTEVTSVIGGLFAQPEPFYDLFIAGCILFAEIPQVPPAFTDHLKQPAPGMIVLFMALEVFDQLIDASGEEGNLYFGRTGIVGVRVVLFHDGCFLSLSERHALLPSSMLPFRT
jgi:hypothetical protein